MGNQLGTHREVEVGGPLDNARLVAIVRRAADLRNWGLSEAAARAWLTGERGAGELPGETPSIVEPIDDSTRDDWPGPIELHAGCGDICPVMCELPYDGDVGGWHPGVAEAIAHAGADLLDLAREVARLRTAATRAVAHVLRRAELQPDGLGRHLEPLTESWALLVELEAVLMGVPTDVAREQRGAPIYGPWRTVDGHRWATDGCIAVREDVAGELDAVAETRPWVEPAPDVGVLVPHGDGWQDRLSVDPPAGHHLATGGDVGDRVRRLRETSEVLYDASGIPRAVLSRRGEPIAVVALVKEG